MSEVKLFKRQSQQMRAVRLEASQLLNELSTLLEKAKTDPPPKPRHFPQVSQPQQLHQDTPLK
jgi:hypothetical protein